MSHVPLVELYVSLNRGSPRTLRTQLENGLKHAVREGRLQLGGRLPPTRVLAQELGISRGVVVAAYEDLVNAGYFVARQGAGTEVAGAPELDAAGIDFSSHHEQARVRWDLRAGYPDLSAFPRGDWLAATGAVIRRTPHSDWGYGDARGAAELRTVLATRLGRTRGIVPAPERIVIVNGSTQAHQIAFHMLAQRGATAIGVEDPGWYLQRVAAQDAGLRAVPIPVDEHGMRVDRLVDAKVDAAVLTPAHQFPLGVPLAPERRAMLLDWAAGTSAIIVEDDYDADFRYDAKSISALHSDAPDRVISIGTLSKTLAPALRLGWLVFPAALASAGASIKERIDNGSPLLEQLVVAELERSGRLDRHLRKMSVRYASRRQALVDALEAELPEARVLGIAAGLHAVAQLPAAVEEAAIIQAARARGILLEGVGRDRIASTADPPMLKLGYGNVAETVMPTAIRALAAAVVDAR